MNIEGYRPEHFALHELVSEKMFKSYPESYLWGAFDARLLWTIDQIREYYNKSMTINNWKFGGDRQFSGLRMPGEYPSSSALSQHRFGRAVDFYISGIDCQKIRNDIKENLHTDMFQYITGLEDFGPTMNWVHIDVRNYDKSEKGLLIFKG